MTRIALALSIYAFVSGVIQSQPAQSQRDGTVMEQFPSYKVAVFSVPNESLRYLYLIPPWGTPPPWTIFEGQRTGAEQSENEVRKVAEFNFALPVTLSLMLENSSQTTALKTGTIPQPKGSFHVSTELSSAPVDIDLTIEPAIRADEPIHVSVAATHCLKDGVVPATGTLRCEKRSKSYEFRLLDGEAALIGGIVGGNRTESGRRNSPELVITITPVAPALPKK